jgi:DNA-binding transcriptional ArsR family regulator
VKPVLNRSPLDLVLQALADPTRRQIVERLVVAPASVGQLAEPLAMSLPAVMQHLAVLEHAGLVRSEKVGRTRTCQLQPGGLRLAEHWITAQRIDWERHLDRLGEVLAEGAGGTAPEDGPSHDRERTP